MSSFGGELVYNAYVRPPAAHMCGICAKSICAAICADWYVRAICASHMCGHMCGWVCVCANKCQSTRHACIHLSICLSIVAISRVFMSSGSCSRNIPEGSATEQTHQTNAGLGFKNAVGDSLVDTFFPLGMAWVGSHRIWPIQVMVATHSGRVGN